MFSWCVSGQEQLNSVRVPLEGALQRATVSQKALQRRVAALEKDLSLARLAPRQHVAPCTTLVFHLLLKRQ